MKKISYLFLIIIFTIIFASCSSNSSNNTVPSPIIDVSSNPNPLGIISNGQAITLTFTVQNVASAPSKQVITLNLPPLWTGESTCTIYTGEISCQTQIRAIYTGKQPASYNFTIQNNGSLPLSKSSVSGTIYEPPVIALTQSTHTLTTKSNKLNVTFNLMASSDANIQNQTIIPNTPSGWTVDKTDCSVSSSSESCTFEYTAPNSISESKTTFSFKVENTTTTNKIAILNPIVFGTIINADQATILVTGVLPIVVPNQTFPVTARLITNNESLASQNIVFTIPNNWTSNPNPPTCDLNYESSTCTINVSVPSNAESNESFVISVLNQTADGATIPKAVFNGTVSASPIINITTETGNINYMVITPLKPVKLDLTLSVPDNYPAESSSFNVYISNLPNAITAVPATCPLSKETESCTMTLSYSESQTTIDGIQEVRFAFESSNNIVTFNPTTSYISWYPTITGNIVIVNGKIYGGSNTSASIACMLESNSRIFSACTNLLSYSPSTNISSNFPELSETVIMFSNPLENVISFANTSTGQINSYLYTIKESTPDTSSKLYYVTLSQKNSKINPTNNPIKAATYFMYNNKMFIAMASSQTLTACPVTGTKIESGCVSITVNGNSIAGVTSGDGNGNLYITQLSSNGSNKLVQASAIPISIESTTAQLVLGNPTQINATGEGGGGILQTFIINSFTPIGIGLVGESSLAIVANGYLQIVNDLFNNNPPLSTIYTALNLSSPFIDLNSNSSNAITAQKDSDFYIMGAFGNGLIAIDKGTNPSTQTIMSKNNNLYSFPQIQDISNTTKYENNPIIFNTSASYIALFNTY